MSAVRFTGALASLSAEDRRVLFERGRAEVDPEVEHSVRDIVASVRREGDAALFALAQRFDRVRLERLAVPTEAIDRAAEQIDPEVRRALDRARANIEAAHRAFLPRAAEVEIEPGVVVGRRPDPLARAGVYAPGGRFPYPSSVLMGVVPARVAGVGEVIVCSPPGPGGLPPPVVLAAAAIGGASRVFSVGGAQAIAAMAFGTASIPAVQRIVGPGNAYVAEAKRQVAGRVGIDAPAGPSEVLVIADETADPAHVARELAAQAEHDPDASSVALVVGDALAARVVEELGRSGAAGSATASASLARCGAVLGVSSLDEAAAFAEEYAAEHAMVLVRDPDALLARIRHAGTVFLGAGSSVAFGDYMTGANHVLPTAGAGKSFSGLSTLDFVRWTTYQRVTREGAARMAGAARTLAEAEGLVLHARAAAAHAASDEAAIASPPRGLSPRASYRAMKHYVSDRSPSAIDLSDNTNQAGAPPAAARALSAFGARDMARYPSHYADELKRALAAYVGVTPDQIVTGCGSDDVLDAAVRAFAEPGESLAYPDPTFAMIPYFARMNGLGPLPVPLRGASAGWDVDAEAMVAARARVTYVCSPNNPTGTLASPAAIDRVVAGAAGLVILDEAYAEYAPASFASRAAAAGNALVVRTLSKAFGLAGMRVGYAVGAPDLVREVEKARGPYKVTGPAERAALAALAEDRAWVERGVREVLGERERFVRWLSARGLVPLPSAANFVLVPVRGAADLARALRERGVAVRAFSSLCGMGDALRISVAGRAVMEQALPVFEEVLPCG